MFSVRVTPPRNLESALSEGLDTVVGSGGLLPEAGFGDGTEGRRCAHVWDPQHDIRRGQESGGGIPKITPAAPPCITSDKALSRHSTYVINLPYRSD